MSFFYDFLDYFSVGDLSEKISAQIVFGVGLSLSGKFKLGHFSEEEIVVMCMENKIVIGGENLKITSFSNGEIFVSGYIKRVVVEDK